MFLTSSGNNSYTPLLLLTLHPAAQTLLLILQPPSKATPDHPHALSFAFPHDVTDKGGQCKGLIIWPGGVAQLGKISAASRLFRVQVDGDNQTVQTQHLGENEDQDHSDEQTRLLGSSTDTGITDDSNGETSGKSGETDSQTSSQVDEAPEVDSRGERHGISIFSRCDVLCVTPMTYLYREYLEGSSRAPAIRTATTRP